MTSRRIALFAGKGLLPELIYNQSKILADDLFVIAFTDQTPSFPFLKEIPHTWVHLGQVGKALNFLKQHEITHVIFAGGVTRPGFSSLIPDWKGVQWLSKISYKQVGDDGLLRQILSLFEEEGYQAISSKDYLPDILVNKGVLGEIEPSSEDLKDLEKGRMILNALDDYDVGQAIIVQQGVILGIEAYEGTKNLILRCGEMKLESGGGVLVKKVKSNQSRLVDLPTIGIDTIYQLKEAGLKGLALEADGCQILHKEEVIKAANESNLFIIGF